VLSTAFVEFCFTRAAKRRQPVVPRSEKGAFLNLATAYYYCMTAAFGGNSLAFNYQRLQQHHTTLLNWHD